MMLLLAEQKHDMLMTVVVAVAAGALLIVLAKRSNVPAIVVLLLGGVGLGPAVWGESALIQPDRLGEGLLVIISLSVGLILFEGGLTLDITGYRAAPRMIKRLLTIGVFITWFGTAAIVRLLFDTTWEMAIISGSLVIVTGPTVIGPLLKRIKLAPRLHNILHWEGVLIDPLGVFIVLLCYEWVSQEGQTAVINFVVRSSWGMTCGLVGGMVLTFLIRRQFVPTDMLNVFALGAAVLIFGVAEFVQPEAGLLAVTVAGFVLGLTGASRIKQVKQFKAELTDLLIGMLFMLLAARLDFSNFREFGVRGLLAVAMVMVLVRPISVFICSMGTELHVRERAFLSWIAPRGVVAASMASLIAISLEHPFVETFTYSVILATVILQGSTAGLLARLLGLRRHDPTGWMIVGANAFARRVGEFFARRAGVHVVLVDSNARAVREAQAEGLRAITADARDISLIDRPDWQGIGNVLALTDNEDLNVRICQNWLDVFGPAGVFRYSASEGGAGADDGDSKGAAAGRVVWSRVPRPSLVAGEIARGDAMLLTGLEPRYSHTHVAIPLARAEGEKVTLDPADVQEDEEILYLFRKTDYLLRAIDPQLIMKIEATSLEQLFREIVEGIVKIHPTLPRDEVIDELLERERSFPTVLGHGVAVPHAYSRAIDSRICAIARVPNGMTFSTRADEEPVDIVFLLLSPQGDPEGHLATLAEIARASIRPEVRDDLRSARTPVEVIRALHAAGA